MSSTSLVLLDRLVLLLRERNFVKRSLIRPNNGSEKAIYNYGPVGALLRQNILNEWRKFTIQNAENENCFMVEDSISALRRQIEPKISNSTPILKRLRSGLVPGCLEHYIDLLKHTNRRLPFTIAQTGVCFRDNDSKSETDDIPFLFDASEVTDMTQLCFCSPDILLWNFNNYQRHRLHWWRKFANYPSNFKISEIKLAPIGEEGSQGLQSCRVLYKFPWGWDTVENIVNWGDGPLKRLKSSLNSTESVLAKKERTTVIPAMVEASALLENAFLAFLLDSFREKSLTVKKSRKIVSPEAMTSKLGTKCLLSLDNRLTPYKIAVTVAGNKRRKETKVLAGHVLKEIRSCFVSFLANNIDISGSLEKEFEVYDQIGVPFTIIVKESSLETGLVDIRNRNTTIKEPVHFSKIKEFVKQNLDFQFMEVG